MSGATVIISPAGYSVASDLLFQDDFSGVPTGTITSGNWQSTFGLQSRGWESVTLPNSPQILDRSGMPAGALSDANCPAGKTRFVYFAQDGDEWNATLNWLHPTGADELYISWWEYRSSAGGGVQNKAARMLTSQHDFIVEYQIPLGSPTNVSPVIFQNSGNGYPGSAGFGTGVTWNNGTWRHVEYYIRRSTSTTASDGIGRLWIDGVLNLDGTARWNYDATDAAATIQRACFGGWVSAGGGGGTAPWPRYIGAVRVSSARQGVWSMT